jgi:hypothetical protein
MAQQKFAMDEYVDVAQRIAEFRAKHPEGCLQPADLAHPYTVETLGGDTYIVVVAAAYRTPDDPRPGIGMAYEVFPGRTPYTKGSELQNAETSAWGRAIVAVGAADTKKGIASSEEVRNRRGEQEAAPTRHAAAPVPQSPADTARAELLLWARGRADKSPRDMNNAHVAAHGRGLGDEEDVDLIRAHMTDVAA